MEEKPAKLQHGFPRGSEIVSTLYINEDGRICNEDGSLATFPDWKGKKVNVLKHDDLQRIVALAKS